MGTEYLTLRDFCEQIRISTSTAYRMIKKGTLPATKIGRHWKVPKNTLNTIGEKNAYHKPLQHP